MAFPWKLPNFSKLAVSEGSPQSTVEVVEEQQSDKGPLAHRWREIQGLHHWNGLLDPLDLELRKSILRYGDFNQAVYDSFDRDAHSKYSGSCLFSKEEFFEQVGLVKGRDIHYEVTRYLYATSVIDMPGEMMLKSCSRESWSKESNWIGYVAVSSDSATATLGRRDIVIVWRGTMRPIEWMDDFNFSKTDISSLLPPGAETSEDDLAKVEKGWLIMYSSSDVKSPFTRHSAREQVLNEVRSQIKKHIDEEISVTILGHSLGAALGILNAFDIVLNGINIRVGRDPILVTAIVWGSPGVGDRHFKKKCEELPGLRILRVKNKIDRVSLYPGSLMGYVPVGEELLVDSRTSPYLKDSKKVGDWHNLEGYLHMVAGTHGQHNPFKLAVNRDVALVNKSSEFLRDEYLVPGSWWQIQHRGLVQAPNGFWYMPEREEGRIPKPEPLNDL